MEAAHSTIGRMTERLAAAVAASDEREPTHTALLQLQADFVGRFSKAFDGKERFERWGKHYARALLRAHQLQLCTNFMDAGLKSYGGALFRQVRDAGEPIFKSLPPPRRCCPICGDAFGLDVTDLEMQRHTESHFGG